jgi:hypothetical protein
MPHLKAVSVAGAPVSNESSRIGTIFVAAISMSILVGAVLLARPGPAFLAVVSDSQAVVLSVGAVARTSVAGRILDADGGPVAGSAVRVRSEARPDWDWVTSSGSDGSFRVDGVVAGKVRVGAQDVEAGIVESPLLEANEARDVVLVLDRTVEVRGVVLDDRGAPIARAAIKCAGKPGAPDRVVIADEDGRFALRGAARSIDRLTAWARGFEATTVSVGSVSSGAIQRDFRLRAARPLHGVVVDPLGNGVAGARVSACPGKEAEVASTDASGAFELPATVMGCSATALHPRFAGARAVRVGDRRELVLRLGGGGAIEGTVVDEHGKPIGLFTVTIASFESEEEGVPGVPFRTGEMAEHLRGSFKLDDLPPGTYVLQMSAEGMVDTQSRPIDVGRGKVIRGEQIVLTAAEVVDTPQSAEQPSAEGAEGAETGDGADTAERPESPAQE